MEDNTLLVKDKDLSSSRVFYKPVLDDKLNTSNKNYKRLQQTKIYLKNKTKNYYCLKLRNIQTQQSKTDDANLNVPERESYKITLNKK